jgi:hypothetical protein
MLVWKAMPSITPMMSTILRDEALIAPMVPTTSATTLPPLTATLDADTASWFACRALSAFCLTVPVSAPPSRLRFLPASWPVVQCARTNHGCRRRSGWTGGGDGVGAAAHIADDAGQVGLHGFQGLQQVGRFIPARAFDRLGQVAVGDKARAAGGLHQRAGDGTRQHKGRGGAQQQGQHRADDEDEPALGRVVFSLRQ